MISVELATLEDIRLIKAIADKNKQYIGFVMRPTLEEACDEKRLLVIKDNKIVIGFCHFRIRKRDQVTVIYELCIDKNYRGQGLGNLLISQLEKPIQLKCPVDNFSNHFYEKCGFDLIRTEPGKQKQLNVWRLE